MQQLLEHILNYHQLSADAINALKLHFQQTVFNKQDHLLEEGKTCRHMYFLEKGALRGYYNLDGKEITHWFAFENDFVTSFHSFITETGAIENIQLLEGSILWKISKESLTELYKQYHEIETLVRIAYEKYYIRLEERFINSQFNSAAERYSKLLQETPHILKRVPLGQVASYLGISQETLSRIRGRL